MTGDGARVRKDGRPLYFNHPVTAEDEIEIYDGPLPEGVVTCGYRSRGPLHEA